MSELINSVPGFEDHTDEQADRVQAGERVTLADGAFVGDPRRVLGHPSNPATKMNFDSLFPKTPESDQTTVAQEAGSLAVQGATNPDLITEVPDFTKQ